VHRNTVRIPHLLRVGAIGALVATVVNASIYASGRAADVAYVITRDGSGAQSVHLRDVVSLSLISFAIGLVAAVIAVRLGRGLRALAALGAVLAVISTWSDFTIDGNGAAKVTLASMHLVVGIAYVASLRLAPRDVRVTHPSTLPGTRPVEAIAAA
jgi:hypothetical protein